MKLGKKELMKKISDLIEDEELKVSVLEDLEDSIPEETEETEETEKVEKTEYDGLKAKYDELLTKYRDRFLNGDEIEEKVEEKEDVDELKEEEIIDIKEI